MHSIQVRGTIGENTSLCRHTGRSFTLVEVLLASILTALIVGAGTSMFYASLRASQTTRTMTLHSLRGQAAMLRLTTTIRAARSVSRDSDTKLTLWAVDDYPAAGPGGMPGNDQVDVSEVQTIEYDEDRRRLIRRRYDFGGVDPYSLGGLGGLLEGGVQGLSIDDLSLSYPALAPYEVTEVWAEDVSGVTFTIRESATGFRALRVDVVIGSGTETQAFYSMIGPVASGYYVEDADARTNDGMSSARLRQTKIPVW